MKLTGTFKTANARKLAEENWHSTNSGAWNIDEFAFEIMQKAEQFFNQPLTPEMFFNKYSKRSERDKCYNDKQAMERFEQSRQKLVFEGFEKESENVFISKYCAVAFTDKGVFVQFNTGNIVTEITSEKKVTTLSDLLYEVEKYNRQYLEVKEPKEMEVFSDSLKQDLYEQAQSKIITLTLTESAINQLKS